MFSARKVSAIQPGRCSFMVAVDFEHQEQGEEVMTKKERVAFQQGVEEGFVRAAELTSKPEKLLRQFRSVSPTFQHTTVTGSPASNHRKLNAERCR